MPNPNIISWHVRATKSMLAPMSSQMGTANGGASESLFVPNEMQCVTATIDLEDVIGIDGDSSQGFWDLGVWQH